DIDAGLTGVVGPNGCGKSNIIDALIWVMGESSAKHLRGESMADVIFNGSNTRKPVGQATVEIVFDNTDGTLGGQYAGFGEISIKRTISRDGVSSYFLNGARCRRKDITHVFLGTGLGSRGYSVIEQGMISRVIEARPEELRGFLEEAAGISKYKERRRETENRMRHTEENIERLDDIREELDKQLGHLQRQARAAERYQGFKADERRLQASLLAARWSAIAQEREQCHALAEQRANELEAAVAGLREIEAEQAGCREAQAEASETFNRVQQAYYAQAGEISRLEQAIQHADEREQGLRRDHDDAVATLAELQRVMDSDRAQLEQVTAELASTEPKLATARSEEQAAAERLKEAESRREQWQHDWDAFNREHNNLAQAENAARIRLEHLLAGVAENDKRRGTLDAEVARNDTSELAVRIAELTDALAASEQTRSELGNRRSALRANLQQSRGAAQALGAALHEQQIRLEELRGRQASLRALQEAAYGDDHAAIERWLGEQGIGDVARLPEFIDTEPGWEQALEAALRIPLGALSGPGLVERVLAANRDTLTSSAVTVIDSVADGTTLATPDDAALLAARVRGRIDLRPLLHDIYAAEDAAGARALLARLPAHAIVALRDGTLLGRNWVELPGKNDATENILARERELARLSAELDKHEADTANLRTQVETAQARLKAMEQEEHDLGVTLERHARETDGRRAELSRLSAEHDRRQARAADILAELERLARVNAENEAHIARVRGEQENATAALTGHAERREALSAARNDIQGEVDRSRNAWRELREAAHALELRLQSLGTRRQTLNDTMARNAAAFAQLEQRRDEFAATMTALVEPRDRMRGELEQALARKLEAESALASARSELTGLDESLREADTRRSAAEQAIAEAQKRLEQVRLDERALEVRLQELRNRFESTGEDFEQTRTALTDEDSEEALEAQLTKLGERIARLGPINLAAIDEFNQLSERKTYLDSQHDDLTEALNTLQEAIRKIDRETRTRFKETFDKVNNGLQAMFPVLFGGGHAYLEMTGDDLLETGVTVMARPPGKRNSTIHLLSGGEKALTALSFVFSIFELNPAPFCLLDEVDAPLDDANMVRLTNMLTSMAQTVQFVFITHNKITMEIAEQLIGVTMHEPGVSRLVSVNMEQAVELAATA
ncbi:MAG: chromosome segregation protein SMC, partial [Gammaproteobacteria bacterium]